MKIKTLLRLQQLGVLLVPLTACADDNISVVSTTGTSTGTSASTETGVDSDETSDSGETTGDGDGDTIGDGDGDPAGDGDGDPAGDGDGDLTCEDGDVQGCYTGLLFTEGVGTCVGGEQTCEAGMYGECLGEVNPIIELCNNLDDDCNGFIDNGNPEGGSPCETDLPGLCSAGVGQCMDGAIACVGPTPVAEVCFNLLDDDCDGETDEFCFGCPYVYAYDGKDWHYETSLGGAALVGRERHLRAGKGKRVRFNPLWVRLDSASILEDRSVQVEVLASEDEIVYLDHAELTAIHHPVGHEVVSSSAMQWSSLHMKDPRQFWAFPTAECRTPARASWCGELDQREALAQTTGVPAAYEHTRDNFYELDFGAVQDSKRAWLLIDGWKFKRSRGLARKLRGRQPEIEIRQADGSWQRAKTISAPRGDRKTVAVDLSEMNWPTGNYEMRLWTGTHEGGHAMWYLDRVRVVEATPGPTATATVRVDEAQLDYRGLPTRLAGDDRPRLSRNDGGGKGAAQTYGRFTRYGDVSPLLRTPDDHMVVMRQGDAVALRFEQVPEPPPGFETSLFLRTNLVYKPRVVAGASEGTVLTENVGPMPRRRMGRYDPQALTHDHPEYLEYLERWNTREYTREYYRAVA